MNSIPIYLISDSELLTKAQAIGGETLVTWLRTIQLHEKSETQHAVWISKDGTVAYVIAKVALPLHLWSCAQLASQLPAGKYHYDGTYLPTALTVHEGEQLSLGWLLEQYRYTRYKPFAKPFPTLHISEEIAARVHPQRDAIFLVRDLINTPPNDMGPAELAEAASHVANAHGAEFHVTEGEELQHYYPAIYTVGKASSRRPCLIDIRWGDPQHPRVTLVGKGVCFDSGGLDIKSSSNMKLMKKDMGGAACVLGLAQLIMQMHLPVRLRVLIPAVENAISGNAFRTSDIITMRSGLTVEVGNTDAEGRLILADALHDACAEQPDLLIDCATLTGAARTALGTDIPALFSNNEALAAETCVLSRRQHDMFWQLPLHEGYQSYLKSDIADISSTGTSSYGGAIIAALFLQHFVPPTIAWMHIDMMAWNLKALAGRPVGGEAMGLRTLFALLEQRYRT
jgi:leucyl aminopeptidase